MRTPPTQFLELLNSIQKNFIWNNSRAKIKHSSIIADYKEGGYKDIDISSKLLAMKISWIKRFLDDNFQPLENTTNTAACTSWGKLNFSL